MNNNFCEEYINKYPWLKVNDSDKSCTWSNCWLGEFEPGWLRAFGSDLIEELDEAIRKDGCEDTFEFSQIKEKLAKLCLYAHGYGENTEKVIKKYEELSKFICGHCGKPATKITMGWYYPLCDKCYNKVKGGYSDIWDWYGYKNQWEILKEIENIKNS